MCLGVNVPAQGELSLNDNGQIAWEAREGEQYWGPSAIWGKPRNCLDLEFAGPHRGIIRMRFRNPRPATKAIEAGFCFHQL